MKEETFEPTTTQLIEFLRNNEFGGATGRPREIDFWLRGENGECQKLTLTDEFSYGDGLTTDLGLHFKL